MMEKENNWLDRLLQNRVLTHTLFWLFVLVLAPITSDQSITDLKEALIFRGVGLPTKMLATYFLAYYLIPQLFQKKKYIQFIIAFIVSTIIFTIIYRFNNIHIAETLAESGGPKESLKEIIYDIKFTVFGYFFRLYFYTSIFIFIKMIKARATEKHQLDTLQKEKATAELNFLKAQIHPHFLFNTLNNLYALTLDKSDKAPDVVSKLSEIMDYMLYQCKENQVLVTKEIELLEHYIGLEKLRYGNRLQLDFKHKIDNSKTLIAPLILVSLVENAFKHGVSGAIQKAIIKIELETKDEILRFKVYNTKSNASQNNDANYKEGIGLKNVKRQLELIYPDQYECRVEEQEESYEVNLRITL
ncbi:sensor histidine kinase [Aquimarina sp. 2201CG14-23]|uniref:sensor histidine kinase n=1 Tax=Aquimarina mycalae TaxID=3040073 RepID=UPI0024781C22|nr:histidine kinase [Aquimarina sp. 2201CG14-23]MDH7447109.1 histidine kinase [Aquimarina sp. 2201CG14-23]